MTLSASLKAKISHNKKKKKRKKKNDVYISGHADPTLNAFASRINEKESRKKFRYKMFRSELGRKINLRQSLCRKVWVQVALCPTKSSQRRRALPSQRSGSAACVVCLGWFEPKMILGWLFLQQYDICIQCLKSQLGEFFFLWVSQTFASN